MEFTENESFISHRMTESKQRKTMCRTELQALEYQNENPNAAPAMRSLRATGMPLRRLASG